MQLARAILDAPNIAYRYLRRSVFILTPNPFGETPRARARFNDAVFYSPQRKYLFTSNEKVANSTMRATFQNLEGGGGLPAAYHPFKRWTGPLLQPSDVHDFSRVLQDKTVYKFCAVRHPYARLISCYRNKLAPGARGSGFAKMMRQLGHDPARDEIDFAGFVRAVAKQDQADMNVHWRPQYYNIFMDQIAYDEIINFDDFNARMTSLVEKFYPGANGGAAVTSQNRQARNSNDLVEEYFSDDLKALAREIYAIDFERFGFNP